jgi:hypothetical protein
VIPKFICMSASKYSEEKKHIKKEKNVEKRWK